MADKPATLPRAWDFVPCDSATRSGGGPYTLNRVRHEIRDPLNVGVPRGYSSLSFYIVLTDGAEVRSFQIQQTALRNQTVVVRWPPFEVDLGSDATVVHETRHTLSEVLFWERGQYEFLLYCEGRLLSQAVIDVR